MRKFNIAVVGATGAVGEEIFNVLGEFNFPVNDILPLASIKSVGEEIEFKNKKFKVKELTKEIWDENEIDIAFFSAGASVSATFAPIAAKSGALVIDNTSYFRMNDEIPLVVPECNSKDISLYKNHGIIANPNCSTIQMLHVLKPLDDIFDIKRVDVSTYQAASGAGKDGMRELVMQMQKFFEFKLDECEQNVFQHRLALNLIPQIDIFTDNDYTKEEMKMINETQKILHKNIEISATCVRVPILRSHSESISIHFKKDVDINLAKDALNKAPSVILYDDVKKSLYPMPSVVSDKNETYVGRIRKDLYKNNVLHLWCAADQIRVGAATNAVRIAQKWIEMQEY